jgi:hypothetical protein
MLPAFTPELTAPPQPNPVAPGDRICVWEHGVKGDRTWWRCDAPALPGRPWCAQHLALYRLGRSRGRFYVQQAATRRQAEATARLA